MSGSKNKRRSIAGVQDERQSILEHFQQVQNRIEDLIKYSKGLVALLKKRVQLDKDHVKSVQKLVSAIHDESQFKAITFDGTLESHWTSVKENLQSEAMKLSSTASTLERQALQPLQVFLVTDLEKRFRSFVFEQSDARSAILEKEVSHDGRKAEKDVMSARAALQKAKEKYYSCAGEWEVSLMAIYREFGDTWSPTTGNKFYEREQLLHRKMQEARSEYEATVSHVNSLQHDVFINQLPQVLLALRTVGENMVAVVNNALKSFSEMQKLISGSNSNGEKPPEQFNAAQYCHVVIFNSISHDQIPLPQPYEFEEFTFKDQSLMVQARKVQYQCMSKLSPRELATRGHQFFTQGEKTAGNPHGNLAENGKQVTCVNVYLVELCLEYLQQPLSLKEEGIFRVPGDSSIIKALHSDFTSGRATREYLRHSVMDQRDPNNISGLLKLHLRENPLLSGDSVTIVQKAMEEMDLLVESLVSLLPSHELELLTKLTGVLSVMCQDPWKTENKMAPRTFGLACGLSIFPQLEPGKAANLLEYLVKHYDELHQSHSIL